MIKKPIIHDKIWDNLLSEEFNKPYFKNLWEILEDEYQKEEIYPSKANIFSAFELTSFKNLKVVILGQDPYHGLNQAHGLSFSVQKGEKLPPSLRNIFKEIKSDIGIENLLSGDLTSWAKQGVLLLNSSLTVKANKAGSHQKLGWMIFTDAIIQQISTQKNHLVFLLWGNWAAQKKELIDSKKHLILEAPHPSPLSARKGFFGCKHFSLTNEDLAKNHLPQIDWSVPF